MSLIKIVINTPRNSGDVDSLLRLQNNAGNSPDQVTRVAEFLNGVAIRGGNVLVSTGAVRASLVGTFSGDPTENDTITINGVAFTAKASGAGANEFNIATGDNVTTCANCVAAINASTSAKIKGTVFAVDNGDGTFTLYATVPGTLGNLFTTAESMDNFAWAGAASVLAGGTDPNTFNEINVGRTKQA